MNKMTVMNPTQKNPQPEPKCPYCDAKPIHYSIVTGIAPGTGYAIVQVFCNDCSALFTAVPAPVPQEESPFGPQSSGVAS
jgi:hypothetical protein